jgi:HEAT repeat protein
MHDLPAVLASQRAEKWWFDDDSGKGLRFVESLVWLQFVSSAIEAQAYPSQYNGEWTGGIEGDAGPVFRFRTLLGATVMPSNLRLAAVALVMLVSPRSLADAGNEPHGVLANEARLMGLIKQTVAPKGVAHKPLPADVRALLAWSKPVNGLMARIDSVWMWSYFVRLKNISDRPLRVPMGNPVNEKAIPFFEIYEQQTPSTWQKITLLGGANRYYAQPYEYHEVERATGQRTQIGHEVDRPWVTLQPGEDCVALVIGAEPNWGRAPHINVKVVLRQPDGSVPGRWSGVLETPQRREELRSAQILALRDALPFPNHYPALSYDYGGLPNGPVHGESAFALLKGSNTAMISLSEIYDPAGVCKEFERRMNAEKIVTSKLLLASIAARAGSQAAALYLLDTAKSADFLTVEALTSALSDIYTYNEGYQGIWDKRAEAPVWLLELFLALGTDDRLMTGTEKMNPLRRISPCTIAAWSESFIADLAHSKYRKVVPLLNERVKKGTADWRTWEYLGEFGDERAVPALIKLLLETGKTLNRDPGATLDNEFACCGIALAQLKARDAVPALLMYVEYPDIIWNLRDIRDERAVPTLRKIVAAGGRIFLNGKPVHPELERERSYAAKVALAHFDTQNEVVHLGKMLSDPHASHRGDILAWMGGCHDPRAIPFYLKVIKTDSDPDMIAFAIYDLRDYKNQAAVEGLIDCFDVAFKDESLGKSGRATPADYRNRIADSLEEITGQQFGADKEQWVKWWQEQGRLSPDLK